MGRLRRSASMLLAVVFLFAYVQVRFLGPWTRDALVRRASLLGLGGPASRSPRSMLTNPPTPLSKETLDLPVTNTTGDGGRPLMVLFSSWVDSEEKAPVYDVTLSVWKSWPSILPVVVTDDRLVLQKALAAGWQVSSKVDVRDECFGAPELPSMFTQVINSYDADYYGFSNGDIIFNDGLEETMRFLHTHDAWRDKPVMVVGLRHNVNFFNGAGFNITTPDDVEQLKANGTLVIRSTDFYFTNRMFPWSRVPPVSLGRVYVVRAVVSWALQRRLTIIDASNTITAVHLTTGDGNKASWFKNGSYCNEDVLNVLSDPLPLKSGHCECALLETFWDEGQIKIRNRDANLTLCRDEINYVDETFK